MIYHEIKNRSSGLGSFADSCLPISRIFHVFTGQRTIVRETSKTPLILYCSRSFVFIAWTFLHFSFQSVHKMFLGRSGPFAWTFIIHIFVQIKILKNLILNRPFDLWFAKNFLKIISKISQISLWAYFGNLYHVICCIIIYHVYVLAEV